MEQELELEHELVQELELEHKTKTQNTKHKTQTQNTNTIHKHNTQTQNTKHMFSCSWEHDYMNSSSCSREHDIVFPGTRLSGLPIPVGGVTPFFACHSQEQQSSNSV